MPPFNSRVPILVAGILLVGTSLTAGAGAFRVCADPDNPPFSDKAGNGFENKIAELFAKQLNRTVEYTWFPQRIGFIRKTLKNKDPETDEYKCDVVMGVPKGYDMTLTTEPYYRSSYVLVYAKNRGWDDISSPVDLTLMPEERRKKLRIAMFDRGPGSAWLHHHGLTKQGVPYQAMTGDAHSNSAVTIKRDLEAGVIDLAIIWGPMAGHIVSNDPDAYKVLPMRTVPGMKFDYAISMGVRHGDKERRDQLNRLIEENAAEIKQILQGYRFPLIEPIVDPNERRARKD